MEVFGLPEGLYSELKPGEQLDYTEEDKEPSHVVSNSTAGGADKAVTLGTGTKIAGNVKAAGEIDPGEAVIQGLVLPGSTEQNLPGVSIDNFDPAGKKGVYDWDGSVYDSVVGRARHAGNLTVGDLRLAEGLLFVDGDVEITGRVEGQGAIVATGKITVTGTMDTQADHAALVARDDITIHGDGPNSSKFQGLVYSEGSIDIARTTIMGAAVSKDSTGVTKLEEVKAVAIPELTTMNFDLHITLEEAKESASGAHVAGGGQESEPIGILLANADFVPLAPNPDTAALQDLGALLGQSDPPGPDQTWQVAVRNNDGSYAFEGSGAGNFAFEDAKEKWSNYVLEHKNAEVQVEEIFKIDLNTLISVDVQLEMMYHTTVRTEQHN